MDAGVIEVIADHACELSVIFIVICVGTAIVIQSFRRQNGKSTDTEE